MKSAAKDIRKFVETSPLTANADIMINVPICTKQKTVVKYKYLGKCHCFC